MSTSANPRQDRIVVVDDDARIRDLLRRYLTQEGFEILLAEDAKALNRIITRETIDLIVLDLMLPGEDGLSLLREDLVEPGRMLMDDADEQFRRIDALEHVEHLRARFARSDAHNLPACAAVRS